MYKPNTKTQKRQRINRRVKPAKGGTAAFFIEFCVFVALSKI